MRTREKGCQVDHSVDAILKDNARQVVLVLDIAVHKLPSSRQIPIHADVRGNHAVGVPASAAQN